MALSCVWRKHMLVIPAHSKIFLKYSRLKKKVADSENHHVGLLNFFFSCAVSVERKCNFNIKAVNRHCEQLSFIPSRISFLGQSIINNLNVMFRCCFITWCYLLLLYISDIIFMKIGRMEAKLHEIKAPERIGSFIKEIEKK